MTIKIQLTLQRSPDLHGQRSNILLLDALLRPLDDAGAIPLSIELSDAATVALVLAFERSGDYDEPVTIEDEAADFINHELKKCLPWKVLKGETLHFEPDTEPDEAEWRSNQSLGNRPFS